MTWLNGMQPETDSRERDLAQLARDVIRRGIRPTLMVIAFGLVLLLTYAQMTRTYMLHESRVSLERYLDGTAHRPFIYRQLVPRAILMLRTIVPDAVARPIATSGMFKHLMVKAREGVDPVIYLHLTAILMAFLAGYAIVGQRLWMRLFPGSRYPELVPIGLLTLLTPFIAENTGHIYDFSVLFFMASLLYMIATRRHALYLLVFAIAMLNKETTILASVAYAACFAGRLPAKIFLAMMSAQALAFLLIYSGLGMYYADNPGSGMENWLREQFNWLFSSEFSAFLAYLGGILLVAYRWPAKPSMIRRSAWMFAPHLLLFVRGAYPGEFRNLYESVPLLSLFILRNIQELVAGPCPSNSTGESADATTPCREFSSVMTIT
jgi:hypothetical protein